MPQSTNRKIRQGDPTGYAEQLADMQNLESKAISLTTYCGFATLYYSLYSLEVGANFVLAFMEFRMAKRFAGISAQKILDLPDPVGTLEVSHGQCHAVAAILLRRWLWLDADPETAGELLKIGLAKPDVPPHIQALMKISQAEIEYLSGQTDECMSKISEALEWEWLLITEVDSKLAYRQFCRVLRRAFILSWKIGHTLAAENYRNRAEKIAADPQWQSEDQIRKIELEWKRLV